MNIIGISDLYHDDACCLLQDGVLVAAAQEERFSRVKADPSVPAKALLYCLREAGITIADVDVIAYYEDPEKKLARQLWSGVQNWSGMNLEDLNPCRVEYEIREILGYEGRIAFFDHHLSHAASSFFFSGFRDAAILTVDGVGEWATTTYGVGKAGKIDLFEEVHFPNSIGLLYSTITSYLGFGVNDGEYKVMGLAPYGRPLYKHKFGELLTLESRGQYRLNMDYFAFMDEYRMYSDRLADLFGQPPRKSGSELLQFHKDVSRSLQVVLEEVLLNKAAYLHEKTGQENLCLAGGVALNCVANGRIRREGPFKRLFVQPASNDAGGALGAAAAAHYAQPGARPVGRLEHAYYGPAFEPGGIGKLLQSTPISYDDYRADPEALLATTARYLAEGKVIGWFHGRMEFGPRSLGGRSILADPRNPTMRDRINAMVKKREGFRPFAPAVLETRARDHFDLEGPSPFMLETCQVISPLDLPAITHVDGSARVQTVSARTNARFAALLEQFDALTGCPILLNTSFNVKGEPIVCTPQDAVRCFISTDIDVLILEDFVIDRAVNSFESLRALLGNSPQREGGIRHDVYTFT